MQTFFAGNPPDYIKNFLVSSLKPKKWQFTSASLVASNKTLTTQNLSHKFYVNEDGSFALFKNGNNGSSPICKCTFSTAYDISTLGNSQTVATDSGMYSLDGNHYWSDSNSFTLNLYQTNGFGNLATYKYKRLYELIPSEYGTFSSYNSALASKFSKDGSYYFCIVVVSGKCKLFAFKLSTPWDIDTMQFQSGIADLVSTFPSSTAYGTAQTEYAFNSTGTTLVYLSQSKLYRYDMDASYDLANGTLGTTIDLGLSFDTYDGWAGADCIDSKGYLYLYSTKQGFLQYTLA